MNTQPPPPLALTKAFCCTAVSHDFPELGDGYQCVCGRQRLEWMPFGGYYVRESATFLFELPTVAPHPEQAE